MDNCIKVEHLTKEFGKRKVLNDISLTVKKGEVFGLLGHNGAGKSTLIDCILGLTKVTEGQVEILGEHPPYPRKSLFQQVGVQLQHSTYQTNIKVSEVCEEMACLYQKPADYKILLKMFKLKHLVNQKVEKLSGGEKQKLSIVIALLPQPEVIFLDELTTGLDVEARREVWQTLKGLKEKGMTIFLTTHYMEEAENLCDYIFILKEGNKVVEGTLVDVIKQSPYTNLEEAYLWHIGGENNE